MHWETFVGRDFLDKNGVRVCILGNISLLPTDIQQLMAEGAEMTKHNDRLLYNKLLINFCSTGSNSCCRENKRFAILYNLP